MRIVTKYRDTYQIAKQWYRYTPLLINQFLFSKQNPKESDYAADQCTMNANRNFIRNLTIPVN